MKPTRNDLPFGLVTFLFTDIKGSTRLLAQLGPKRYAAALEKHRSLVRSAVAAHGGIEVDTQGDAFFVAFPDAASAVRCCTPTTGHMVGDHRHEVVKRSTPGDSMTRSKMSTANRC